MPCGRPPSVEANSTASKPWLAAAANRSSKGCSTNMVERLAAKSGMVSSVSIAATAALRSRHQGAPDFRESRGYASGAPPLLVGCAADVQALSIWHVAYQCNRKTEHPSRWLLAQMKAAPP